MPGRRLFSNVLATKTQFVTLEGFVFAPVTDQSHNGDHDLGGQKNHPEVHAFLESIWCATLPDYVSC